MIRRSVILVFLLVASLMATIPVRALELSTPTSVDCCVSIKGDEPGDQSSADSERTSAPHHCNCHGHFVVSLARDNISAKVVLSERQPLIPAIVFVPLWNPGTDLRPPIT